MVSIDISAIGLSGERARKIANAQSQPSPRCNSVVTQQLRTYRARDPPSLAKNLFGQCFGRIAFIEQMSAWRQPWMTRVSVNLTGG
jgi:hypothetical protein